MTRTIHPNVRGWCPGALRPMESGDGLIARVRARAGAFPLGAVGALCEAAERFGNGLIDLTHRANLQIRGVTPETLPKLLAALADLRLLDANAEAEAVRNVMVSPLAGADPAELMDIRPLALDLEHRLGADPELWRLPGKFGFLADGGGRFSLHGVRVDIRLLAVPNGGATAIAIGVDRSSGPAWLGEVSPGDAPSAAALVAKAYLAALPLGARERMRDLPESAIASLRASLASLASPLNAPPAPRAQRLALGAIDLEGGVFAVGAAAAFGSVEAHSLKELAAAAAALGGAEVRLSLWRALFIPIPGEAAAQELALYASRIGFIVDPGDPLLRIDACPGAPACRSAALETRSAARTLAGLLAQLEGIASVHVSGCSKGCARPAPADLVLAAEESRFAVIRNGKADGRADMFIAPQGLSRLPAILASKSGAEVHV